MISQNLAIQNDISTYVDAGGGSKPSRIGFPKITFRFTHASRKFVTPGYL